MPTAPLTSLLAAVDLSATATVVLDTAAALAARSGAALHVLHAFELPASLYGEPTKRRASFPERIAQAEARLHEQIGGRLGDAPVASAEVVIYEAYKAIYERAQQVGAELIVLGAHRPHPLADLLLGSTVDRVLRTAEVPCLVTRAALRLPLRRVVVPVDFSASARAVAATALAWAGWLGDADAGVEVHLLHVVPQDYEPVAEELVERVRPALHDEVEAILEETPPARGVRVHPEVRWGASVPDAILAYAAQTDADLLALGTQGYGALAHALLGSIAAAVTRRASLPVLLRPAAMRALPDSRLTG